MNGSNQFPGHFIPELHQLLIASDRISAHCVIKQNPCHRFSHIPAVVTLGAGASAHTVIIEGISKEIRQHLLLYGLANRRIGYNIFLYAGDDPLHGGRLNPLVACVRYRQASGVGKIALVESISIEYANRICGSLRVQYLFDFVQRILIQLLRACRPEERREGMAPPCPFKPPHSAIDTFPEHNVTTGQTCIPQTVKEFVCHDCVSFVFGSI